MAHLPFKERWGKGGHIMRFADKFENLGGTINKPSLTQWASIKGFANSIKGRGVHWVVGPEEE